MLDYMTRTQALLTATAGVTLTLGLAVSAGVLPAGADDGAVRAAAASDPAVTSAAGA